MTSQLLKARETDPEPQTTRDVPLEVEEVLEEIEAPTSTVRGVETTPTESTSQDSRPKEVV